MTLSFNESLPAEAAEKVNALCDRFESAWKAGVRPRLQDFLDGVAPPAYSLLVRELVLLDIAYRRREGEKPMPRDYAEWFPEQPAVLHALFQSAAAAPTSSKAYASSAAPKSVTSEQPADDYPTVDSKNPPRVTASLELPYKIGRYRVIKILGKGHFGCVYLAHDDDLNRAVAIKVPLPERVARPKDIEAYLAEARTLAALNHPHIIAVFDVGRTENGLCFVVSKFVEGTDLAKLLKQSWPSIAESARLVATVAEALHHAHRHGLVHRDVKPANILIDVAGNPVLADFGLAMRDADFGKGADFAGTPVYMSPEQANGEGHRVDGRSDIFSLGVVFYELLTKSRPFKADSREELLEKIANVEPKPPREIDDAIPKELERICLKALAKRKSDRYTAAKDMADDLMLFLAEQPSEDPPAAAIQNVNVVVSTPSEHPSLPPASAISTTKVHKIVPKGLRSFDAHDAGFFLELLPGPRDRDGLPDSIRFWKSRIEDRDSDAIFSVGLIYGPSGCGKSSLVKAGLLPHLSDDVIAVYIEATAADTEARLLNGLRKRCPSLGGNLSLKASLAVLRRGQGVPAGKKILIVLDQFEQWLHAKKDEENSELVQALRQCDGVRVQCLVMVRDDFWLAVSRFMRELEVPLLEGRNSALIDLFDTHHALKVLTAFGRAFGRLTKKTADAGNEQKAFLDQAVSGLAQEGKIVSVRLALFAEMMKGKKWTPASLKEVGGAEGVGIAFLEETFSATTAPPEHRFHQRAARAVLKALLPEAGTDMKGHMRSRDELLEASGTSSRPKDFDDLIRILDGEIRLITPTDPEGKSDEASSTKLPSGAKYYQLTHDYLVPTLRDWLTRKQRETRRGRAELVLQDRAAAWNSRPENRQLPSFSEWLRIVFLTRKRNWTAPQTGMMRKASRFHVMRAILLAIVLVPTAYLGLTAWHSHEARAESLVQTLLLEETARAPANISKIAEYRWSTEPALRRAYGRFPAKSKEKLHAGLALLPSDANRADFLFDRFLDAQPHELPVIFDALSKHDNQIVSRLLAQIEMKSPVGADADLSAHRTATAAAALLKMNQPERVWPLLKHSPDPSVRSYLIHRFAPVGADAGVIVKRLSEEPDLAIRRALILSLGAFPETKIAQGDRERVTEKLKADYCDDPDPGLHSAAEWLLRLSDQGEWLKKINDAWRTNIDDQTKRLWCVNSQGQMMIVIRDQKPFDMGTSNTDLDRKGIAPKHRKAIQRTFAVASKAVTVEQYQRFDRAHRIDTRMDEDLPAAGITWYQAAKYCNWLSEQERIPEEQWCFEMDDKTNKLKPKKNYLRLTGYRLPSEVEMEYVTRAGATTSRFFAETDELLPEYAWYLQNSKGMSQPVGRLKPNDWGFFDVYGNSHNWCQEGRYPYDLQVGFDATDQLSLEMDRVRVLRGGSYLSQSLSIHSAARNSYPPNEAKYDIGFRPARTLAP